MDITESLVSFLIKIGVVEAVVLNCLNDIYGYPVEETVLK